MDSGPGWEIVPGRKGKPTVKVIAEDGSELLLHSLYDPDAEALSLIPDTLSFPTVVLLGVGLGWHIPFLLQRFPNIRQLVIVERYPELAARAALRVPAGSVAVSIVTDGDEGGLPTGFDLARSATISHPASIRANPGWYARMQGNLAAYGKKPAVGSSSNCKRIILLYGAYYGELECARGFEALGHEVVMVDYRRRESEVIADLLARLAGGEGDLVFSVNMRGLDRRGAVAEGLIRLGVPLALWFLDSPEFIMYGEAMPPREVATLFIWDRSYIPALAAQGYRAVWLPLAADPTLAERARYEERFAVPISFVGNSLASGFLARLAVKFPLTAETSLLAEQAVQKVLHSRGFQLDELERLLVEAKGGFHSEESRLFFRAFVLHGATTAWRTALLERLIPLGLEFFGDPQGWRTIFSGRAPTHPDVNYFSEAPCVYRSATINVNATSLQMPQTVNQRVFDVPASGGFLLTDRQHDLAELFEPEEVAVYDGPDDIADRAGFYLGHGKERGCVIEKARRRVLMCHTYRQRMQQLLDGLTL